MKIRFCVLVITIFSFAANADRIDDLVKALNNDGGRCAGGNAEATPVACEEERQYALSIGCITPEEAEKLKRLNLWAMCNRLHIPRHVCTCGCFDPSTRLLVERIDSQHTSWMPIEEISVGQNSYKVWTVDKSASLSSLARIKAGISRFTKGPEHEPLIFVETEGANRLGVTTEHAVLLASGEMVAAKELKVGQKLVNHEGQPVLVTNIQRKKISQDVINLLVDQSNEETHLVLAEGLVVGDLAWQNSLKSELGQVLMRQ